MSCRNSSARCLPGPPGLQEYLCRRCGATYTSLDAVRLLDPMTGAFRCEECKVGRCNIYVECVALLNLFCHV